ncbi:hypothetical protein [Xanthobacter versatilis]|uniref:hypothetical protein n=1 Tax=Xanthobacter autotrophicus (strain ATCC BAA-1158 / Py2) TaxID=78245 RepID=UPI0037267DE6
MSRRAARFTQADLARVFKAAKAAGMAVRVDLVNGVAEVIPYERLSIPCEEPKPKRFSIL